MATPIEGLEGLRSRVADFRAEIGAEDTDISMTLLLQRFADQDKATGDAAMTQQADLILRDLRVVDNLELIRTCVLREGTLSEPFIERDKTTPFIYKAGLRLSSAPYTCLDFETYPTSEDGKIYVIRSKVELEAVVNFLGRSAQSVTVQEKIRTIQLPPPPIPIQELIRTRGGLDKGLAEAIKTRNTGGRELDINPYAAKAQNALEAHLLGIIDQSLQPYHPGYTRAHVAKLREQLPPIALEIQSVLKRGLLLQHFYGTGLRGFWRGLRNQPLTPAITLF
ncbi:hypothetical protein HYW44_03130 [Candidatus Daviesbacteria bacterium]|nr:hypothetical protein [Candidatus Daviesbacteria bacterium]